MKRKTFILPVLSTLLLAPAFLAHQVAAEEAQEVAQPAAELTATGDSTGTSDTAVAAENGAAAGDSAESQAAEAGAAEPAANAAETEVRAAEPGAASLPEATILHTNDVHGRIVEERGVIGDAKLAAVIKEERAKNPGVLVVDAGDAFQGLPISNSSKGEERARILNEIGYDAMAVGNHEFDFGLDEARKYREILTFPLLSSNTYVNGARVFEASTIIDKDPAVQGDEFVVIGVTTPETATKTHPKNIQGVSFTDPITEVNTVIDEIEARAAAEGKTYNNYVILAHLGVDTTTPVEWRGSTLAQALADNPKLRGKRVTVIDGHSHTVESVTYGDNVTYNQTGSYLHNIGKVTFKAGELLGDPQQISAASLSDTQPDPTVAAMVSQIKEKYDQENAAVVVANSPVELNGDRDNVRVRETNLGNVVADALYQYGQTGFSHRSDLAVTNGGGLRETIAKNQPITKGDIIAVLPFGNTITQISVTGEQLAAMFAKSLGSTLQERDGQPVLDENGQPLLEASGGFLHVSGARVYYDTTLPADQRVLAVQIFDPETGDYRTLDPDRTYYLTTNDFLAAGGDGYTMLGGPREEGPSMDEAFRDYLTAADLTAYAVINPNSRLISLSVAADSDGDGFTDVEEIRQGTDPADPASRPAAARPGDGQSGSSQLSPAAMSAQQGQTRMLSFTAGRTFTNISDQSLPQTGSRSSALGLLGLLLASLGFAGLRKSRRS